ncbi:MAG: hypothetical protein LBV02_08080 [Bacteroidales bacterium]|jgi:hypothetical protein|nr:hypothetical protein [Bacteroidales bacterium]
MKDSLQQIFKLFTHPLMMPVYFLIVLFVAFGYFGANNKALFHLLFFVFVSVSFLPAISLLVAARTKLVDNPMDPMGKDKIITLILLAIFSLFVCKMWHDKDPDMLYTYIFAVMTVTYLFLLLSYFIFELDLYTTFWGALLGFYLILLQLRAPFSMPLLATIVIIAALSTVLRSPSGQKWHNARLFAGYFAGMVIAVIVGKIMLL